jgi:hypothetical protein
VRYSIIHNCVQRIDQDGERIFDLLPPVPSRNIATTLPLANGAGDTLRLTTALCPQSFLSTPTNNVVPDKPFIASATTLPLSVNR